MRSLPSRLSLWTISTCPLMNPRQEADPEGIAFLADSVALIGLIQPIPGSVARLERWASSPGVAAGARSGLLPVFWSAPHWDFSS